MKRNKINFAIASYHIVNGKQTCFALEKRFKQLGYKTETFRKRKGAKETTYAWKS